MLSNMQINSYWIVFVKCSFPIKPGIYFGFHWILLFLLLSVRKDACCCRWWGDITHTSPLWFLRRRFYSAFTVAVVASPPPSACQSVTKHSRPRRSLAEWCSESFIWQWETGHGLSAVLKGRWHDCGLLRSTKRPPTHMQVRAEMGAHVCFHEHAPTPSHVSRVWVGELPAVGSKSQRTEPQPAVYVCSPSVSVSEQHFSTTKVRGEVERLRISSMEVDERQSKRRDGWTASSYQISPTLSQTCSLIVL